MSSLPILLNIIDELDRESHSPSYFGNDFGFGLYPHHIYRRGHNHHHHPHPESSSNLLGYSPLGLLGRLANTERRQEICRRGEKQQEQLSVVGKDGFQACMDVAQFKPSELSVKVTDSSIVVEGKHEEREDNHGYISRHFVRRYALPNGYDADKVMSTLSSDGVLTVSVPKPQLEELKGNERIVQIQQTGPAHLNVKQNSSQDKGGETTNGDGGAEK